MKTLEEKVQQIMDIAIRINTVEFAKNEPLGIDNKEFMAYCKFISEIKSFQESIKGLK